MTVYTIFFTPSRHNLPLTAWRHLAARLAIYLSVILRVSEPMPHGTAEQNDGLPLPLMFSHVVLRFSGRPSCRVYVLGKRLSRLQKNPSDVYFSTAN